MKGARLRYKRSSDSGEDRSLSNGGISFGQSPLGSLRKYIWLIVVPENVFVLSKCVLADIVRLCISFH
jgi:hypothetical protein